MSIHKYYYIWHFQIFHIEIVVYVFWQIFILTVSILAQVFAASHETLNKTSNKVRINQILIILTQKKKILLLYH